MGIKIPILICLFFTFFYSGLLYTRISTDAVVATMLPVSLIRHQSFDLTNISPTIQKYLPSMVIKDDLPYHIFKRNNHQISIFPVFLSVIATPIYFFPVILNNIYQENLGEHFDFILYLGKISASFFSAVSVSFVFLCLREYLNNKKALMLTILYALGTSTLSISSQFLWQHGASQMFLSIAIYFFIRSGKKKALLSYCGLFLGFATLSRYPNIIISLAFFLYILIYERKYALAFLLFSLPSVIFFAWYQLAYPGDLFFYKYEAVGQLANFNNNILTGISGLLIAPSKGLFIYSPFFLFTIWGSFIAWKEKNKQLIFFSIISLAYIVFMARWSSWHGGISFGPRMLTDITPFLTIIIVTVINKAKIYNNIKFKQAFFFSAILSIFIHFLGVSVLDLTYQPNAWNWDYPEIVHYYIKAGGGFGVLYLFSQQLIHISITIIFGFSILFILYIVIHTIKKALLNTLNNTRKLQ